MRISGHLQKFQRILNDMLKIGLALGGGGARGLAHINFIKVLDELRVKPHVISGSSIGAIIGGYYAAGLSGQDIENLLEKISFKDINKMIDFSLFKKSSMLKGKGVQDFFKETFPTDKFEELDIPLKVATTDFWNRKQIVFDSGDLLFAIRASMSLPIIFEPVKYKNTILIDGGVVNPVPYDLVEDDCDYIIAIDVAGLRKPTQKDDIPHLFDYTMATVQIMQSALIEHKIKISKPDLYISPALENVRILDFHRADEIMQSVSDDVDYFKKKLTQALENKKFLGLF
jgi:NTE family protein